MISRIIIAVLSAMFFFSPAAAQTYGTAGSGSWYSKQLKKKKYYYKKRSSKKRYGKKRYSKKRYAKKRYAKKRYGKKRRYAAKKKKYNAKFPPGAAVWNGGPKPKLRGQAPKTVRFRSKYKAGTIVVDTSRRKLYYVRGRGKAYAYPIAVGKKGFGWTGTKRITRKASWPTWRPPAEMRQRKPQLPKKMTGGLYNPLGAKALYLGSSLYRIHGTYNTASIGTASSSGCFRMHNKHVVHLSRIARVGTRVVVRRSLPKYMASR